MSIKVGDRVELVDIKGLFNIGKVPEGVYEGVKGTVTGVRAFPLIGVELDCGQYIAAFDYRFKVVPTLSDLRAEALKAYDAGLLRSVGINSNPGEGIDVLYISPFKSYMRRFTEDAVEEGLRYLQSLYTTEFKIGTEEDLSRVSKGAKGVLSNGNEFGVLAPCACTVRGEGLIVGYTLGYNAGLYMDELKGATITQSTDN